MVFSAGGTTAVPIEIAMGFRAAGLRVIAVTSVEHSRAAASQHSSGTRLLDHADVVLDLCTPPGDALVEVGGTRVGPGSSVAAVALANAVKVRTAELLAERGALPPVLAGGVGRRRRGVGAASSTRPTPSTRAATPRCCARTSRGFRRRPGRRGSPKRKAHGDPVEREVPMNKTVASVMSSDPYVVSRHASVVEAAAIMRDRNIGSVPVVDNGYLLGIITDRDLAVRVVAEGLDPSTTKVEQVATSNLHSASPDDSLDEVYERMTIWRIRRLPIVEHDGRLVGMLAQADLVHELKDKKAGQLVEEISQPGDTFYGRQEVGIS